MELTNPIQIPGLENQGDDEDASANSSTPPEDELITTLHDGITPAGVNVDHKLPKPNIYASLPSSSYSSLMPYQAPQVKEVLKICFQEPIHKIVDLTAHIGGDSILFAETFPGSRIVAIDIDPNAVRCLHHNVNNFSDPSRFTILCANSVEWIKQQGQLTDNLTSERSDFLRKLTSRLGDADFYYLDSPWGGPRYYSKKEVHLTLDGSPIVDVINTIFMLGLTRKVLLKVPRNFAYPSFKASVKGTCKLFYIKKPLKHGSIAYGLILITDEKEHSPYYQTFSKNL